ncbi:MAG: tyrosine--tRNA ligase [Candidatus Aenigmatarchaeota archaeon]
MDIETKMDLITKNTEEVLSAGDLKVLLQQGVPLKHYIGLEISGKVHLGTGIMTMLKIRDFQQAGIACSVLLADWHSWINDKLGGDLDVIKRIAGRYFKEGMKASLECVGGDTEKLKFVLGSNLYHNNDLYWQTVVDISKHITLARSIRSITIMGRKAGEAVDFAKLIYPSMQAADIFIQDINIAHAGTDQRSAHVIARETALKLSKKPLVWKGKKYKPVAVHGHLILGLQKPPVWPIPAEKTQEVWSSMKMSKSIPKSAVFIHDTEEEIRTKLNFAFCPPKHTEYNPVLDWAEYLIFREPKSKLLVERPKKYGGDITFSSYKELKTAFAKGKLHPQDLKNAVAEALIKFLKPARKHFAKPRIKKMKDELESLKITR